MRICFWQSDLLLLGQGLRLLETCRLAWGSLTSLRCRISELARAAILPCPAHSGPPTCPITQGHVEEQETAGVRSPTITQVRMRHKDAGTKRGETLVKFTINFVSLTLKIVSGTQNSWCCESDERQLSLSGLFVVFQVSLHGIRTGKVAVDDPWSRAGILGKKRDITTAPFPEDPSSQNPLPLTALQQFSLGLMIRNHLDQKSF